MTKLDVTKKVAGTIVSFGTYTITNTIIRQQVQPRNVYDKIIIVAASFAIGGMASEATQKHTEKFIDEAAATYHKLIDN